MSQKDEIEQQKEDLNVEKENENDDKTDIQQNQSLLNQTNQDNSRIQAASLELRNSHQEENQEQAYLPKEVSNVATPTRTSQIETSPVGKIDRQSLDGSEQKQDEQIEQSKEQINEQEIVGTQIKEYEHHEDKDQKQSEKDQNESNHQNEQGELQKSFHSFQKSQNSDNSTKSEKITILQSALQMKDELIITMQDEIQVLKQSQLDKQKHIETMEKKYEEKLEKLFKKVGELEKLLKEKENDIEQFRNGNQTLHLQDLSVISLQKNENLKSNANDKKDVTIFEVLNEKQTTADLSELGNNFWLISAERKIQKSNPLYSS